MKVCTYWAVHRHLLPLPRSFSFLFFTLSSFPWSVVAKPPPLIVYPDQALSQKVHDFPIGPDREALLSRSRILKDSFGNSPIPGQAAIHQSSRWGL